MTFFHDPSYFLRQLRMLSTADPTLPLVLRAIWLFESITGLVVDRPRQYLALVVWSIVSMSTALCTLYIYAEHP